MCMAEGILPSLLFWKVGGSGEVRLLVCLFVARLEYQITIHVVVVPVSL